MTDEKEEFKKVSIPPDLKREIAILAANEGRYEYEIVVDAMKLYKQVTAKPKSRNKKNSPATNVIVA